MCCALRSNVREMREKCDAGFIVELTQTYTPLFVADIVYLVALVIIAVSSSGLHFTHVFVCPPQPGRFDDFL